MSRRILLSAAVLTHLAGAAAASPLPGPEDAAPFARPDVVPFPAGNAYSAAKAELGRRLFFDPRLSGAGDRSCASCHDPARGWEDGRPRGSALDGGELGRRVPTIVNGAWGEHFFWDGRASSLEDQALGPVQNPREMNQTLDGMVGALRGDDGYAAAFAAAFPERPEITPQTIAAALATFERTVVSPPAPFDAFAAGDTEALTPAARRGFALFTGKAGCVSCHSGWSFTDHAFHDVGLPGDDRGRGAVLGLPDLDHAFKTPSLRGLTHRGPYMHDGSLATLRAVVDHYAEGIQDRPTVSPDLPKIDLDDDERNALVAFLESLSGPAPAAPLETVVATVEAPPPAVRTHDVSQKDKAFHPGHLRIARGETVHFLNDDSRTHNIRIHDPRLEVDSGMQDPGQTVTVTPPEAGTYYAFCGIHPKMKLVIDVAE